MKNALLTLMVLIFLTGCRLWASPAGPVETRTTPVDIEIYHPPMPTPLQMEEIRWHVITEENAQEKIQEIKDLTGDEFVVYGVVPKGYENMAWNFQEIRRYIRQLMNMITYYREVTGAPDRNTLGDWIQMNEELRDLPEE